MSLSADKEQWPGIFSRFQLVMLAGLRSKQLLHGGRPRILTDPLKRKNTSIALEELKMGLIGFHNRLPPQSHQSTDDADPIVKTI